MIRPPLLGCTPTARLLRDVGREPVSYGSEMDRLLRDVGRECVGHGSEMDIAVWGNTIILMFITSPHVFQLS